MDCLHYIQENVDKNDSFSHLWSELHKLYVARLWHQLTIAVERNVNCKEFSKHVDLQCLYEKLLSNLENQINSLALTRISIIIGNQIAELRGVDETVIFLTKVSTKLVGTNGKEAYVRIMTEIGFLTFYSQRDFIVTQNVISRVTPDFLVVSRGTDVYTSFYKLSSDYNWAVSDHSAFYTAALTYLSCLSTSEMNTLSDDLKEEWAVKLCVSALLGTKTYNFGELLMHEIVKSISKQNQYLLVLVRGFNEGLTANVEKLHSLLFRHHDLCNHLDSLKNKLDLMCLKEVLERYIGVVLYTDIAKLMKFQVYRVDNLVLTMKELRLIECDRYNDRVNVISAKPRVQTVHERKDKFVL